MPDRKYADATQLNLVAAREPGSDLVENCAKNVFDVALIEMRVAAGDTLNELIDAGVRRMCGRPFPRKRWQLSSCGRLHDNTDLRQLISESATRASAIDGEHSGPAKWVSRMGTANCFLIAACRAAKWSSPADRLTSLPALLMQWLVTNRMIPAQMR